MNSIEVHVHVFLKKIKPRGVGVGVEYGQYEGVRDVST